MATSSELEDQLVEAGNKLLKPPSSVEELLFLLDEAVSFLNKVEQSPAKPTHDALSPLIKALVEDVLMSHSNVDVKVALASCLSEITRITAPDAPYDDEKMKAIFEIIVSSFENLYDESSRSFKKRVMILETASKVRLCVVMLDLECDELISKMFQYFLKAIREYHPNNIFSSMEGIMTVVLEESEDISMDLVTILLASVKKENEEIKPIGKRLAECVFINCAVKLKPYVRHAVKSRSLSLDEYSKVVTSVMQGIPVSVEHIDDTSKDPTCAESKLAGSDETAQAPKNKASTVSSSELGQMTEGTKQEARSKDVNQDVNTSPKSVVGSDVTDVNGGNTIDTQSLAKLGGVGPPEQPDIAYLTPKSASDDSQVKGSMKAESDMSEKSGKEQGRKSNSQVKLKDSLDQDPVNNEKVAEKLPGSQISGSPAENSTDEQKSKGEGINNLRADDTSVERAKLLDENDTSARLSLHKKSEDEAENVASSNPSQFLPDEIRKGTTQLNEDDGFVRKEYLSAEIASKKLSEETIDSESQPQGPGTRVQTETSQEEEADSMSDANVKFLNQRDEKAISNKRKSVSSKKKDKGILPKEDDCLVPEEPVSAEIASKKPSEGTSDSESRPLDPGTRVQTETSQEEEAHSMSDAGVKGSQQRGEKAISNKKKGVSSNKKDKGTIRPKEDDSLVLEESVSAEIASKKPSEVISDSESQPQDPGTRVQTETYHEEEAHTMSDAEAKGLEQQGEKAKANKRKAVPSKKKEKGTIQPKEDDSLVQEDSVSTQIAPKKPSEGTSDSESQPQDPGTRVHTETSHEEEADSRNDAVVKGLKKRGEKANANKRKGVSSKKKDKETTHPKEDNSFVQEESVSTEVASQKPYEETSDSESLPQDPGTRVQRETSHEEEAGSMSDADAKGLKQQGEKDKGNKRQGASSKKKDKRSIQPKEDDSLVLEDSVSTEIDSRKPYEGTSDTESQRHDPGTRVQREASREEEADSMSNADVKGPKQRGEKAKSNKRTGGSSKKKDKSKRRRQSKASMEIDASKSSAKDENTRTLFSEESPLKSAEDDGKEANQKKSTKRKRSLGKEKVPGNPNITYDESLVGSKVEVWWPLDNIFYEGVIESFDRAKKKHRVLYTDGEVEDLNLRKEKWHIVRENLTEKMDLGEPSSPDDASAEMHRQKKKKTGAHAETSSKHDKLDVSPKSSGSKSKSTAPKPGRKSKDEASVEPKPKDRPLKSFVSKSKDVTDDSDDGSEKLKDVICSPPRTKSKPDPSPKITFKSLQDTASKSSIPKPRTKTPHSGGKHSANGSTGKPKPMMSKGKEIEDVKERPTEVPAKTSDSIKGKGAGAFKEHETEFKSGKKGSSSKEQDVESKSGKKRRRK